MSARDLAPLSPLVLDGIAGTRADLARAEARIATLEAERAAVADAIRERCERVRGELGAIMAHLAALEGKAAK